jgi:hypothetical protein
MDIIPATALKTSNAGGKGVFGRAHKSRIAAVYTSSIASYLLDHTSSYLFSLLLLDTTSKGEL